MFPVFWMFIIGCALVWLLAFTPDCVFVAGSKVIVVVEAGILIVKSTTVGTM